jgi:hypothetical protein
LPKGHKFPFAKGNGNGFFILVLEHLPGAAYSPPELDLPGVRLFWSDQ